MSRDKKGICMTPAEFRFVRKLLGLNQEQMGLRLEKSRPYISNVERGGIPINKVLELAVKCLLIEHRMPYKQWKIVSGISSTKKGNIYSEWLKSPI